MALGALRVKWLCVFFLNRKEAIKLIFRGLRASVGVYGVIFRELMEFYFIYQIFVGFVE